MLFSYLKTIQVSRVYCRGYLIVSRQRDKIHTQKPQVGALYPLCLRGRTSVSHLRQVDHRLPTGQLNGVCIQLSQHKLESRMGMHPVFSWTLYSSACKYFCKK